MRLGIIGAMEEEIALLLHDIRTESRLEAAGRTYYLGRLYGSDVVLVFSRWGKVASASTTATLLTEFDIGAVVFAGVAGAVSKDLSIGDVVVASDLVQHDLDVRPLFEQFAIPILGVKRLQADPLLTQAAVRAAEDFVRTGLTRDVGEKTLLEFGIRAPKVVRGLVASGDQFIADTGRSDQLRSILPDLLCVEMEGAAVAQVCAEHQVPFAVVRAVSDTADHDSEMDFLAFLSRVASHYTRGLIRSLLGSLAEAGYQGRGGKAVPERRGTGPTGDG